MKIDFSDLKRNISLIDLILAQGYSMVARKSAKSRVFLEKGDDKVMVYKNGPGLEDFYYTTLGNETDGGDIINFLMNKGISADYREAGEYLVAFDPAAIPVVRRSRQAHDRLRSVTKPRPFQPLPTAAPDENNYLVSQRGLHLGTLCDPKFKDAVFNQLVKDAPTAALTIFPLQYQNKVVGQEVRGDNHRKLVVHSDKTHGLWMSVRPQRVRKMAVFESPIDAISHYQLFPDDNENTWYVATIGSASRSQSLQIARTAAGLNKVGGSPLTPDKKGRSGPPNQQKESVTLALAGDNDYKGQLFNLKLLAYYVSERFGLPLGEFRESISEGNKILKLKMALPESCTGQRIRIQPPLEGRVEVEGGFLVARLSIPADLPPIRKLLYFLWDLMELKNSMRLETPAHKDFNQDLAKSSKKSWGQSM